MFPEKSVNVEKTLEFKLSQNSRQDAEPFPAKRLSLRKDFSFPSIFKCTRDLLNAMLSLMLK